MDFADVTLPADWRETLETPLTVPLPSGWAEGLADDGSTLRVVWWGDGGASGPIAARVYCLPQRFTALDRDMIRIPARPRWPTLGELAAAAAYVGPEGAVFSLPPITGALPVPAKFSVVAIMQTGAIEQSPAALKFALSGQGASLGSWNPRGGDS